MERPRGVTIVAIFLIMNALLSTLVYLFFSPYDFLIKTLLIITTWIISIVLAYGLLTLKTWALKATRAFAMIFMIVNLFTFQIISFIIYAAIFWYSFRPEVKKAFRA